MRSTMVVSVMLILTLGTADRACGDPSYRRDVPAKLAAEAKISESAAVAAAQRTVPTGTVVALELEREHKVLMYSIDLTVPGTNGATEVEVDASDGHVLGSEHESASDEDEDADKNDDDSQSR